MVGEGWRKGVKKYFFCSEIDDWREAWRDPDNLNRLASSLIERLTPDQEDKFSNPLGYRTWPANQSSQVLYEYKTVKYLM